MPNIVSYNLIIRYDESEDVYYVHACDFNEFTCSFGKTKEEAIQAGKEIIVLELDDLREHGITNYPARDIKDYKLVGNEEHHIVTFDLDEELKQVVRHGKPFE